MLDVKKKKKKKKLTLMWYIFVLLLLLLFRSSQSASFIGFCSPRNWVNACGIQMKSFISRRNHILQHLKFITKHINIQHVKIWREHSVYENSFRFVSAWLEMKWCHHFISLNQTSSFFSLAVEIYQKHPEREQKHLHLSVSKMSPEPMARFSKNSLTMKKNQ